MQRNNNNNRVRERAIQRNTEAVVERKEVQVRYAGRKLTSGRVDNANII